MKRDQYCLYCGVFLGGYDADHQGPQACEDILISKPPSCAAPDIPLQPRGAASFAASSLEWQTPKLTGEAPLSHLHCHDD